MGGAGRSGSGADAERGARARSPRRGSGCRAGSGSPPEQVQPRALEAEVLMQLIVMLAPTPVPPLKVSLQPLMETPPALDLALVLLLLLQLDLGLQIAQGLVLEPALDPEMAVKVQEEIHVPASHTCLCKQRKQPAAFYRGSSQDLRQDVSPPAVPTWAVRGSPGGSCVSSTDPAPHPPALPW